MDDKIVLRIDEHDARVCNKIIHRLIENLDYFQLMEDILGKAGTDNVITSLRNLYLEIDDALQDRIQ